MRWQVANEPNENPTRKTVYLTQRAAAHVEANGKGKQSRFVSDAILRAVDPPYRFHPHDGELYNETFLNETQHSIIALGITLRRLAENHTKTLEALIRRGVTITAAVLDPTLPPEAPVYQLLLKYVQQPEFVERIRADTETSVTFLRRMQALSVRRGRVNRLFYYDEAPNHSLVIRDYGDEQNARMHLSPYINPDLDSPQPFWEINPCVEGGAEPFQRFWDSYNQLLARSTAISLG